MIDQARQVFLCVCLSGALTAVTSLYEESYEDALKFNSTNEANIPKSRQKRFLAFPSPSSLAIDIDFSFPMEDIDGIDSMLFQTDLTFDLASLFPVPTTTTTTTSTTQATVATPATHHHYRPPSSSYSSQRLDTGEGVNRLTFYKYMENFLNRRGYNGRQCTLRTLCETAEAPFDHGLYGDLFNLVMAASSDPQKAGGYDEYMTAEYYGKYYGECDKIYSKCPQSVLGVVSKIF